MKKPRAIPLGVFGRQSVRGVAIAAVCLTAIVGCASSASKGVAVPSIPSKPTAALAGTHTQTPTSAPIVPSSSAADPGLESASAAAAASRASVAAASESAKSVAAQASASQAAAQSAAAESAAAASKAAASQAAASQAAASQAAASQAAASQAAASKAAASQAAASKAAESKAAASQAAASQAAASQAAASRAAAAAAAARAPQFPFEIRTGDADRLITVAVPGPGATKGTLTAWQKYGDTWRVTYGPIPAFVGAAGVGDQHEGSALTPQGTFTMTEAFGALPNPGTPLPYFQTDDSDWWVSDVTAPTYNTHQRCEPGQCPFDTGVSERLARIVPQYNYAVVMDVNRDPIVPGKGSAFFLHATDGKPTAGCVAVTEDHLVALMQWLRPGALISVGVG